MRPTPRFLLGSSLAFDVQKAQRSFGDNLTIYFRLGIIEIVSGENVAAAKKPDVVLYSGFYIALLVLIFGNLAANQGLVLKYSKSKA